LSSEPQVQDDGNPPAEDLISRRAAISKVGKAAVGGGVVIVAGAAGAYYLLSQGGPSSLVSQTVAAGTTLTYYGDGVDLGQQAIDQFKSTTGIGINASAIDFYTLQQKLLATGGTGFDIAFTGRIRDLVAANYIAPIDVTQLPRWVTADLEPLIVNPGSFLKPNYVTRFNYLMWATQGTKANALCNIWNYDSVSYNPNILTSFQESGGASTSLNYKELFNPSWKGKVALQDEGFTTFSETANMLEATSQIPAVADTVTNLSQNELNSVVNYLTPIIKTGQAKTFWSDLGTIITLMSTSEVAIASTWQPVCYGTRDAGTPCYYARLENGPFFWWNGDFLPIHYDTSKSVADYKFFDFMMSPWWAANTAHNGYGTINALSPAIKSFMGDEFWGWMFNGTATYESLSQTIKDIWGGTHPEFESLPARLQGALFTPDKYFPTGATPRTGSPDPNGVKRDLGSISDKNAITRYFLSPDFPDNNTVYTNAWSSLKAQVPA
jgi:spermidine/putrescine-binding protein